MSQLISATVFSTCMHMNQYVSKITWYQLNDITWHHMTFMTLHGIACSERWNCDMLKIQGIILHVVCTLMASSCLFRGWEAMENGSHDDSLASTPWSHLSNWLDWSSYTVAFCSASSKRVILVWAAVSNAANWEVRASILAWIFCCSSGLLSPIRAPPIVFTWSMVLEYALMSCRVGYWKNKQT